MSKFFADFRTVRTDLKAILFICLFGILLHDLWLENVEEIFAFGSEIGKILYGLAVSYIASFIFYFLVVHSERENEKRVFLPYIEVHIRHMLASTNSLIREIVRTEHPDKDVNPESVNRSEVKQIFSKIDPRSRAPFVSLTGVHGNWMQYLNFCRTQDLRNIRRVLDKGSLIETELNRILSNIEVCNYYSTIEFFGNMQFSNTTLAAWAESFDAYMSMIDELRNYAKIHLVPFVDS